VGEGGGRGGGGDLDLWKGETMIKPGGVLVYEFTLTDLITFQEFETVNGAPGVVSDIYGDRYASGIIKRAPAASRRKAIIWCEAHACTASTAGVRLVSSINAESMDADGKLTELRIGVAYVGPVLGGGEFITGELFCDLPNFENVGL
jgi:hypothetical protein